MLFFLFFFREFRKKEYQKYPSHPRVMSNDDAGALRAILRLFGFYPSGGLRFGLRLPFPVVAVARTRVAKVVKEIRLTGKYELETIVKT
jgi:hypothetical protein